VVNNLICGKQENFYLIDLQINHCKNQKFKTHNISAHSIPYLPYGVIERSHYGPDTLTY